MAAQNENLLGTLDTSLSGRRTLNDRKMVKSKGNDCEADIVNNLEAVRSFGNGGTQFVWYKTVEYSTLSVKSDERQLRHSKTLHVFIICQSKLLKFTL